MRIYKIAEPILGEEIDEKSTLAVKEAIEHVNLSVANINKSLETLKTTGVLDLFTKEGIIDVLQSGNMAKLDVNIINNALNAMKQISNSALMLNNSMRVIKENPEAAKRFQADINTVANMITTSLQSGDYSQFSSIMGNYQSALGGMVGTN